jgi:hypothetical protein
MESTSSTASLPPMDLKPYPAGLPSYVLITIAQLEYELAAEATPACARVHSELLTLFPECDLDQRWAYAHMLTVAAGVRSSMSCVCTWTGFDEVPRLDSRTASCPVHSQNATDTAPA